MQTSQWCKVHGAEDYADKQRKQSKLEVYQEILKFIGNPRKFIEKSSEIYWEILKNLLRNPWKFKSREVYRESQN